MKLVVGLGNPGSKYKNNRHNVGYLVADELKSQISKLKTTTHNLKVVRTNTFVNESGKFVKHLISQYPNIPISNLYVVHDDLDIPLGSYKIQFGKGPKDHKGLNSIYHELGTEDFWHVRVGVDNRNPRNRIEGEEYVLQDFTTEEKVIVNSVIDKLIKNLKL